MLISLNYNLRDNHILWILIALTAFMLELLALWFQYVIELQPCVLCIYERCALFGIIGAGILGAITKKTLFRYIAIITWLYSSLKGIELTWHQIISQLKPSFFLTCDFVSTNFPNWLPLDKWLPHIFSASNNCSILKGKFLELEIQQWLLGIFIIYFVIALLVLIAQLFLQKNV